MVTTRTFCLLFGGHVDAFRHLQPDPMVPVRHLAQPQGDLPSFVNLQALLNTLSRTCLGRVGSAVIGPKLS
jgi:hypothetical protein